VKWVEASGRGTVYSYTVVHRAANEAFADQVPYVIALIDLEEGVRLMTRLSPRPVSVRVGAQVIVHFERVTDEVTLPIFRLAQAAP
jgi:hypothetical protein